MIYWAFINTWNSYIFCVTDLTIQVNLVVKLPFVIHSKSHQVFTISSEIKQQIWWNITFTGHSPSMFVTVLPFQVSVVIKVQVWVLNSLCHSMRAVSFKLSFKKKIFRQDEAMSVLCIERHHINFAPKMQVVSDRMEFILGTLIISPSCLLISNRQKSQHQYPLRLVKNSYIRKRQPGIQCEFMECRYIDIFITENVLFVVWLMTDLCSVKWMSAYMRGNKQK